MRTREVAGLVQLYSTLRRGGPRGGSSDGGPREGFATSRFAALRQELAERVRVNQAAGG